MAITCVTQQKSTIPLNDLTGRATGTLQWHLEHKDDDKTPIFQFNNLSVYICGEDSFRRIAEDIQTAEQSIDIIAWGFDPAMELTRTAGPWGQRGDTYGDLLRDAAQGKLKSKKKVQVRLLLWYDALAVALAGSNMPGYKQRGPYEANASSIASGSPAQQSLRAPVNAKDGREIFNAHWYSDVVAGKIEGLSLRTRGTMHKEVAASLKAEAAQGAAPLGRLERLGLELLATHHQKTIVIDYEGSHPRAYVMGLNSVTDYWDTKAHVFNDPRRGENFEGDDKDHSVGKDWKSASSGQPTLKPYQDYVCRLEGDAVAAVYKNFVEAWNTGRAEGKGAGQQISANIDLKKPPARLTQNLTAACNRAQILRTLPDPEGGERSIERMYLQASSFARHYLYIENQYFQHTDWAHALKEARKAFVKGCTDAKPPVPVRDIPVLHVMVVTPTPERGLMVPRTLDTMTELGHGDSMPGQEKLIQQQLKRFEYEKTQALYEPSHTPPTLSPLAESYLKAGGTQASQATRDLLSQQMGMRTLVASLWTYEKEWDKANLPVSRRIEAEQRDYAASKARAGTGISSDIAGPSRPPDRSQELKDATAQRYREI